MALFDALLQEMAPDLVARHLVEEELLAEARRTGITGALALRVRDLVLGAAREPGALVVCTCSTLGGCAERANEDRPGVALRIDRPMAERAVRLGHRITIAAALGSTLEPTRLLVEEAARAAGREVRTRPLLCEGAFSHFERGDLDGYHRAIARVLERDVRDADVVILAQASMAGAAPLCMKLFAPVLSSPRLGLAVALARYRSR
ncbi:MAG TPA: hypothetical protein DEP35_03460 [Deltaproteobacteria bacterium]|nr:hypothetical protein [Deltaproteobacteria bacterium]